MLDTSNNAVCDKGELFGGFIDEKIQGEYPFPNFLKGIMHAN
jgi:hypothetical protein